MVFSRILMLWNNHLCLVSKWFHHPKIYLVTITLIPALLPPQPGLPSALWVCFFWAFSIHRVIHDSTSDIRLFRSALRSRFIRTVVWSLLLPFYDCVIFHCLGWTTVCLSINLLIGIWVVFTLAVVTSETLNMCAHVTFKWSMWGLPQWSSG